jgi:myo-inositol-1(or 4)-monophosphatase
MTNTLLKIDSHVKEWFKEFVPFIHEKMKSTLVIETKRNSRDLVSNIDKEVEQMIREKIATHFPHHQIIGEENGSGTNGEELNHVWLIDPIDGTTNFIKQRDHFCVLIAYYENNIGKLGYIYDVMNNDLYHAMENEGAYVNHTRLLTPPPTSLQDGLISTDVRNWYRQHCFDDLVNKAFDIRSIGCGGLDSIQVFQGKFAAFINTKSGPWDLAAQLIFAKELGLKMTKFDGTPVDYLVGGDYILANPVCHEEILNIMKDYNHSLHK